ncbi:hypothetical protein ACHQM5_006539 [Ranunculus cassubicifolius]
MSSSSPTDFITIPRGNGVVKLSKGFRFQPRDHELVAHYLRNKVWGRDLPCDIIPDIDLYSYDADQLPIGEFKHGRDNEAYFFTCNNPMKFCNGYRPTSKGYWKASNGDEEIFDSEEFIGYKKTLVFYLGTPPDGEKTNYVMQEYRLNPCLSSDDSKIRNNVSPYTQLQIFYIPTSDS